MLLRLAACHFRKKSKVHSSERDLVQGLRQRMIKAHDTSMITMNVCSSSQYPTYPHKSLHATIHVDHTHTRTEITNKIVSVEKTVLWHDFDMSLSLKFLNVYCLACHSVSVFCGTIMRQGLHHQHRLIGVTFRLYLPLVSAMVSVILYHHVNNCCCMLPPP